MSNWTELKRLCSKREESAFAKEVMNGTILALIAENSAALDLLAVIHKDGGQHVDNLGFIQSCVLAEQKIFKERSDFDNWVYVSKTVDEGAKRLADYAVKLEQERDQLRAEVEALRKDAERYRHLKDQGHFRAMSIDMGGNHSWTGMGRHVGKGTTIDEAIDSEIARDQQ